MDVAPVGVHGALAVGNPPDEGEAGVKNGQAQHQEGDGKGDDGVKLEQPLDGHHRQHIAQKGGPGVPHKNLGGVQVVGQKADAPPGQSGHEDGGGPVGHHQGDDQQGHGADGGHAAGQTVQAVNQVDGIGNGHNPQDGEGNFQYAELPIGVGGKNIGVGQGLNDVAGAHRHQGGGNLHKELGQGFQGVDIVKNAQHHNHGGPQEHPPQLGGELREDEHTEHKAEKDGQTAHAGDGVVVHTAVVLGYVHRAHLSGQIFDHRGGHQGNEQGHHQGGGHHSDERGFQFHWHETSSFSSYRARKPTFLYTFRKVFMATYSARSAPARQTVSRYALSASSRSVSSRMGRRHSTTASPTTGLKAP